jgi:hypothetical protein
MLDIPSLAACGWLLMYNPTEDVKLPITEWEQSLAFDTAAECETLIATRWVKAEKEHLELNLSGIGVCLPMRFILKCRPRNKNRDLKITRPVSDSRLLFSLKKGFMKTPVWLIPIKIAFNVDSVFCE